MALPDLLPPSPAPKQRLVAVLRLAAAASIIVAAIAVVMVARGSEAPKVHMLIATALGVGLSVLVGTALIGLLSFKYRHGHDPEAPHVSDRKDKE